LKRHSVSRMHNVNILTQLVRVGYITANQTHQFAMFVMFNNFPGCYTQLRMRYDAFYKMAIALSLQAIAAECDRFQTVLH
jgi:hypothetical protein